jgi:hypothetical protein
MEKTLMNKTKSVLLVMTALCILIVPVAGMVLTETEEPSFQIWHGTDKLIYRRGEPVNISFENNEQKILYLPEIPPWEIWKFEFRHFQWQRVIDPLALQIITPVLPGGVRSWTWNQKDSNGEQVSWGLYRADIPYSESLLEWKSIISHSYFIII